MPLDRLLHPVGNGLPRLGVGLVEILLSSQGGGWLWPGGSEQCYVTFYLKLTWLGVALGLVAIGFGLAGVVAFGGTPP